MRGHRSTHLGSARALSLRRARLAALGDRHSEGEAGPLGTSLMPRLIELSASQVVADSTAVGPCLTRQALLGFLSAVLGFTMDLGIERLHRLRRMGMELIEGAQRARAQAQA